MKRTGLSVLEERMLAKSHKSKLKSVKYFDVKKRSCTLQPNDKYKTTLFSKNIFAGTLMLGLF
jgi:hypothetical protein